MEQQRDIGIVAERTQYAAGMRLTYRLTFEKGFWLTVVCGKEDARRYLGSDMESAWLLFCLCVKGGVTPCTLGDVCDDFFYAQAANIGA